MKKLREKSVLLSLFFSAVMLATSCTAYDQEEEPIVANSKMNITKYSGEDIFLSLYFGYGEFAQNIPQYMSLQSEIEKLSANEIEEVEDKFSNMLNVIKGLDSNFFIEFAYDMKSGNHNIVLNRFNKTNSFLQKHSNRIFPEYLNLVDVVKNDIENGIIDINSSDSINNYVSDLDSRYKDGEFDDLLNNNVLTTSLCGPWVCAIAVALYFVLAVHNVAVGVVNIYLVANFWGPDLDNVKNTSVSNQTRTDLIINDIATFNF